MTRAQIADPHLVRKLAEGRPEDIRPCVGANYCIDRLYAGKDAVCLHSPATGKEAGLPHEISRAQDARRVVVVGGGPAGLEAARVCAARGHAVVLFERETKAGGQLRLAMRAPARGNLGAIATWLEAQARRHGAELRLGYEATAERVLDELPDVVVIATGGRPHLGEMPGAELAHSTWSVLDGSRQPRGRVLVYDEHGEHQALSCAEKLARDGAELEIVTPARVIGEELGSINFAVHLKALYAAGVRLTPDHRLVRLAPGMALLRNEYTRAEVERSVDAVVLELGTLPVDELYLDLVPHSSNEGAMDWEALVAGRAQPRGPDEREGTFQLFRIGDAVASRNVAAAVHDALRLCKDL
jgi:thioredoxin reductase